MGLVGYLKKTYFVFARKATTITPLRMFETFLSSRQNALQFALICISFTKQQLISRVSISLRRVITVFGMRWRSWLRNFTTSRGVAGSIPEGVMGFVNDIILPAGVLDLASTQLVTDRSTVDTYWRVKAADA